VVKCNDICKMLDMWNENCILYITSQIYHLNAHIYSYNIYLQHSLYMFQCAIHHLQGGLLIFLLKTMHVFICFISMVTYIIGCRMHTIFYNLMYNDKKSNPFTGLDRPWGFQEAEAPRFQDTWHMKVVTSALCTSCL
jgi:hypothetical protein